MQREVSISLVLFAAALLLRSLFLNYPSVVVFDEGIFASHITHLENGGVFFDIHPPLSKFLFWLGTMGEDYALFEPKQPTEDFGDFPYARARAVSAFAGSLLVVIVYLIGKELFGKEAKALLPAILVLLDSALIIYSRLILLDIFLVLWGFAGVYAFLVYKRTNNIFVLATAGVFFGCALSIKWTGLAFLAYGLLFLLYQKKYREMVLIFIFAAVIYISCYALLFALWDDDHYSLRMLPWYTSYILDTNLTKKDHVSESRPWEWPASRETIGFWKNEPGTHKIVLAGNVISWIVGFLAALFGTALLVKHKAYKNAHALAGFLVSFVPFFFIPRALFIYHYFPALIWSYFLIPELLEGLGVGERGYKIVIIVVVIVFIVMLPTTYGIL